MAQVKITELTALTAADSASTDVLPVVDVSADATKKLAISDLHRSVPDGTLSAPGIAFQSDLNSGLYRSGTDAIALVTNGAARILINANGDVTIPNDLTVQGTTTCAFAAGTAAAPSITFVDDSDTGLYRPAANQISLATAGTDRVRIDSSGIVKIGTANTPSAIALIGSSSNNNFGQLQLQTSGQFLIGYGSTHSVQPNELSLKNTVGDLTFYTGGNERLKITSTGNAEFGGAATFASTITAGTETVTGTNVYASGSIQGIVSGSQKWYISPAGAATFAGDVFAEKQFRTRNNYGAADSAVSGLAIQGSDGTANALIKYDGSASFAGAVDVGTFSAGTSGIRLTNSGTIYIGGTGNNAGLNIGSSAAVIDYDGSATFAGGNINFSANGAATFNSIVRVKDQSGSTDKIVLDNNGSATFAGGTVTINNDLLSHGTGNKSITLRRDTGKVIVSSDSTSGSVFEGQLNQSTSSSIKANGSASYASTVTVGGGDPSANVANGAIRLAADGNVQTRKDTTGEVFVAFQGGNGSGNKKVAISSDGSASFAGGNVEISNGTSGEGKLEIYRPGPTTKDAFVIGRTTQDSRIFIQNNGNIYGSDAHIASAETDFKYALRGDGSASFGPQYDRLNVNPGSGSYDGDPTSVVIDGRTNDGNATAFKIDRFDGSGNASTKFFVNYAGNVGIQTTNPVRALQIGTHGSGNGEMALAASTTGNCSILMGDGATGSDFYRGYIQYQNNTDSLVFATAATQRLAIDSSGRLLVGTTTYTGNGQVAIAGNSSSNSAAGIVDIRPTLSRPTATDTTLSLIRFGGADHTSNTAYASINVSSDGASSSESDLPGRLEFHTTSDGESSPTERMRLDDEGIIYHNSSNHGIGTFVTASAGTVKYAFRGHYGSSAGSYGGNISFTVWSNGNVENTNNSYGAISDIKLKENIVDANSQWNDLKALQVRNYNFIEGQTHTQIGLVAQEVELVSPGLVSESPDVDEEGNDLGTVTKSVNYSVLYMKAVKALQEAMERIETLEAKVAALEGV